VCRSARILHFSDKFSVYTVAYSTSLDSSIDHVSIDSLYFLEINLPKEMSWEPIMTPLPPFYNLKWATTRQSFRQMGNACVRAKRIIRRQTEIKKTLG
jgi:hypothetical protein